MSFQGLQTYGHSVILTQMKTGAAIRSYWACASVIGCNFVFAAVGQGMRSGNPDAYIKELHDLAGRFKAGETNVSILAMGWFSHGVNFCQVEQSGRVVAGLNTGLSIRGGSNRDSLDVTNRLMLLDTINNLPPPPSRSIPTERQVVISGIRSNQWFYGVYRPGRYSERG